MFVYTKFIGCVLNYARIPQIVFSKKNQIKDPNNPHLGSIVGPGGDESNQTIMRLTNIYRSISVQYKDQDLPQNMIDVSWLGINSAFHYS